MDKRDMKLLQKFSVSQHGKNSLAKLFWFQRYSSNGQFLDKRGTTSQFVQNFCLTVHNNFVEEEPFCVSERLWCRGNICTRGAIAIIHRELIMPEYQIFSLGKSSVLRKLPVS